ncbi:MAG: helix-turn-helix domain-containing protein [Bacteroidota bacterium]|jgi:DNA-binding transcriptional regulator YiaG
MDRILTDREELKELLTSPEFIQAIVKALPPPVTTVTQLPEKNLLTQTELADKLKVNVVTIQNWQNKGYIKPLRLARRVYYRIDEITEMMKMRGKITY